MLCSPYGSSIRSHVSHKTIQTNSLPFFLPFCWHKLRWENMLLGLKITTTTTQSHQLNNMSNVWVKIHCDGDGKQQHSFQPSQGCQPGGLHLSQAHRIWGGAVLGRYQYRYLTSFSGQNTVTGWNSATTHNLDPQPVFETRTACVPPPPLVAL